MRLLLLAFLGLLACGRSASPGPDDPPTERSPAESIRFLRFVGALSTTTDTVEVQYLYTLQLESSGDGTYSGVASARSVEYPEAAVETRVTAELLDQTLIFQEVEVVSSTLPGPTWCLGAGTLQRDGDDVVLGSWEAPDCDGSGTLAMLDRSSDRFAGLPDCPCWYTDDLDGRAESGGTWRKMATDASRWYHPGSVTEVRWTPAGGGTGQQCTYNFSNELITGGLAAGTPDLVSPGGFAKADTVGELVLELLGHFGRDVFWVHYYDCATYLRWYPPNNGNDCPENIVTAIPEGTEDEDCGDTLGDLWKMGQSGGDPHLRSFDGLRYDMQAVGELVLMESTTDDLEVQIRTAPWGERTDVSMVTAVAARVDGQRVGLYATDIDLELHIDGEVVGRTEHSLDAGGAVRVSPGSVTIEWPDGTSLQASRRGPFVDVTAQLPPDRFGEVVGLLGDGDGEPGDDLALPDGQPLGQDVSFAAFYEQYVMAWRVTDASSLFDYAPSESTATFTDLAFPSRPARLADLTERARLDAEAVCLEHGVSPFSTLMDACILDVALTGDPAFARSAVEGLPAWAVAEIHPPTFVDDPELLVPKEPIAESLFGFSVATADRTILVGSPRSGDSADIYDAWSGSVHVFEEGPGGWVEVDELVASDPSGWAHFGWSVAMTDDTAIVGAPYAPGGGAAYVFERVEGQWIEIQRLSIEDDNAEFGRDVAISGDLAVVGARFGDSAVGTNTGTVSVYRRVAGSWVLEDTLEHPAPLAWAFAWFGYSVAVHGDDILVGAPQGGPDARGAALHFRHGAGGWELVDQYGAVENDGAAVAMSEQWAASAGWSTSLWSRVTEPWTPLSDGVSTAIYAGGSLTMTDRVLVVGNFDEVWPSVQVLERGETSWFDGGHLEDPVRSSYSNFGIDTATDGTRLVIGAPLSYPEAVWVYEAR